MIGNIIYFSGTGNTEYIGRTFKEKFSQRGIDTKLVDIAKKKSLVDEYDFLVLGAPVYAEMFPRIFINWIEKNIKEGNGREAIVFSTLGGKTSNALNEVVGILSEKGFNVKIAKEIEMPNNYYLSSFFKKPKKEEILFKKEESRKRVEEIVNSFLNGENIIQKAPIMKKIISSPFHRLFTNYSNTWARKNLSVNMDKCVKCSKCSKNCPTKNITVGDEFIFRDDCVSCLKCVNCCPVNAFLYKNKEIDQYKL